MNVRYDLFIIGAGMAGISAANKAAAAGWRTAIVDELPYGGTCALRGCDPKKILRRGAEVVDAANLMRDKGIDPHGLSINWADLMCHTRGFTDPAPANAERQLASNGVDTLHGAATFTSPSTIDVAGTLHEVHNVLVATGARPRSLGFPGAELMIDSTEFLHLESLPPRIVFVGGGFVSFEFAHIAARAGSAVTILDRGERPLGRFDPDLVDLLVARSAAVGIDVRTRSTTVGIEELAPGYRVRLDTPEGEANIDADLVVHGAGRVPQLGALGLDHAGVAHTDRGITVEAHLQSTTNPAVWAAGDAADTDAMALTPVAVFEGKVAVSNMVNGRHTVPDYRGCPPRCSPSPSSPGSACSSTRPATSGWTSMSDSPTPAAGTPTIGSARRPQPPRSSSTPPPTPSSAPTCSAPITPNSSTCAGSRSNSASRPANSSR